jgi:hypothetical protein
LDNVAKKELIQSILITGPSGVGKSSFARSAIAHEGSGLVIAAPGHDELDSYYGANYTGQGFDDVGYPGGAPTGLRDIAKYLYERLSEVKADRDAGQPPRYKVLVVDTVSAIGQLAFNATLARFGKDTAPPALSPDGAAFYSFLRAKQEETMRVVRAFKGYGVHLIALTHIGESEVSDANVAKETEGKIKVYTPLVPGGFKAALPALFSTVLAAGIAKNKEGKRVHYLQWQADGKKLSKSRLGLLSDQGKIPVSLDGSWKEIKTLIEAAASRRSDGE